MPDRIEDKIKAMIVERLFLPVKPEEIDDEDNLMEKFEIDSVRLFEIVIGIEEIFGVTFEDEEFSVEAFQSVKAISDVVKNKLQ